MAVFISRHCEGAIAGDPGIATHTSYARNDGTKRTCVCNDGVSGGGLPRLLL